MSGIITQYFGDLASRERCRRSHGPMALRPRLTTGLPVLKMM